MVGVGLYRDTYHRFLHQCVSSRQVVLVVNVARKRGSLSLRHQYQMMQLKQPAVVVEECIIIYLYTRSHARTLARMLARTHARTHTHTHARTQISLSKDNSYCDLH